MSIENPIISIVVPVYNVEPYLPKSIESILGQEFKDFELICVDDASTDASGKILQRYAARDKRIRIIEHKENKGAGTARNEGMAVSRGEWIIFLDADDYFSSQLLSKAYKAAQDNEVDVVYVNFNEYNQADNVVDPREKSLAARRIIEGRVFSGRELGHRVFEVLPIVPWNKLCRKSFLQEKKLKFQELPNANDVYFGSCVAFMAERNYFLLEPLVTYRTHHAHQISAKRGKNPLCAYKALKQVKDKLDEEGAFECHKGSFYWQTLSGITYALRAGGTAFKPRLDFRKFLNEEGWKNLGMEDLQEEDFFYKYDYERWIKLKFTSDTLFDEEMFSELKDLKGKSYIWGFGDWGKKFYEAAKYHGYAINGIIDENTSLKGKQVDGLTVLPCREQDDSFEYVIITNEMYGRSVRERLDSTGHSETKIIDMGDYMFHNVPIKECIF
ncbi:MAG: glycosyltransferase family 2 protein [Selenomonas sp.]|nr:glycosyltransferase family 2 protein [Selenomonas sp.]